MNKYFALSLLIGMALGGSNNSIVKDEAFYDNGNKSGDIWIEGYYSNGIRVEIWTTYYENGQESTKGNYKIGERNGQWIFFNKDGTVYEEKKY